MNNLKDIRESLHLPQTPFRMKANLPKTEPEMIEAWKNKDIYKKIVSRRKKETLFSFVDGPPYANGNLHVGHALNKILKDIIVKYMNLSGRLCPFIPTWDCHGLPIEMEVLKKMNSKEKKEASPEQIRQSCRETALSWVGIQKKQFERLGILADWNQVLLTLDPEYEAQEIRFLAEIVKKDLLYRGKKPVFWCSTLQTAIASSEVEYRKQKSPSIYVKFPVLEEIYQKYSLKQKSCAIVIWTTTPWTLPANQAICLNPNFQYAIFDSGKEFFILAEDLQSNFEKNTGFALKKIRSFNGKELENLKVKHPFIDRDVPIILGEHVTKKEGTGCVHTAPGHGLDDFIVGSRYQLPVFVPVDSAGKFTEEIPEWKELHIFKANPLIIEKLREKNCLLGEKEIIHNYPFNPRSNTPLIFRATDQWFIKFDHPEHSVRKKSLKEIENNIQFCPSWGQQRLKAMIKNSPDWCLSRQRHWGVPIPVFYCKNCQKVLLRPEIMMDLANKIEKSKKGIEYWFSHSPQELLPAFTACQHCKSTEFQKGTDILDVWFDSGICHYVFQKKYGDEFFPAQLYLEGSDQHRGWFQNSLNSSVCVHGKTPFRTLITHCFVNDVEGHKMSKSKGNVVSLENILKQKGADILRLWVASEDYSQDLQMSQEILDRVSESYRRIRNTFRFMLGNLFDFAPEKDCIPLSQMKEIDRWILSQLARLTAKIRSYYEQFLFHKIYQEFNVFFTNHLSSLYLDIVKDRLYTFQKDGVDRKSVQSAMYHLLNTLLPLMSPILSFLSEEAYQHIPGGKKQESIFLTDFPNPPKEWHCEKLDNILQKLLKIRQLAFAQIEKMKTDRLIGSNLETQILVTLPENLFDELKNSKDTLKELLITSQLRIQIGESLEVEVKKMDGDKCERCWHYSKQLNIQKICPKCMKNLYEKIS